MSAWTPASALAQTVNVQEGERGCVSSRGPTENKPCASIKKLMCHGQSQQQQPQLPGED